VAENIKVNKATGDEVYVEGENFTQKSDVVINENSKVQTVPSGKTWVLQFLTIKYISEAGGSARQLAIEIGDGTNLLWPKNFGATQAGGLTRNYYAASDLPDDNAFDSDGRIRMQLEAHVLPAGYTVKVYDVDNRDATDDMELRLIVDERNAGAML